jgi:cystathionine beta-lyase family protein involved in aluminum resistance
MIAPCGGYIAGSGLAEAAAAWLSAPCLEVDSGSTPVTLCALSFKVSLSSQMVGEALKGDMLIAEAMAARGYEVQPQPLGLHHDTVQVCILFSTISTNIME